MVKWKQCSLYRAVLESEPTPGAHCQIFQQVEDTVLRPKKFVRFANSFM